MSRKTKAYTKKHLAAARRRQAEDRKAEQAVGTGNGFWRKHDSEMSRALRGVDLTRYEELADEPRRS